MVTKVQLQICLLLGLVYSSKAQLLCPRFTIADLGNTTDLSTEGLLAGSISSQVGEVSIEVPVKINDYRILCDASGSSRDTSSYVSVLVEFQCSHTSRTGSLAQCDGMTNITRQYQYRCSSSNVWINAGIVQTLTPTATFQTEPTNQCRLCADPAEVSSSLIDQDTHCLSCDQTRCSQGQGRCYANDSMEVCCQFYLEEKCIADSQCPAPLIANSTTFECSCQSLSLDYGSVGYTNGLTVGSVATYTCDSGYRVLGEETRNCTRDGWSGQNTTCEQLLCPELSIDNGQVVIVPPNRTINSKATYSCSGDYNIKGDRERFCQAEGTWSGVLPECEKKTGLDGGAIAGIVIGVIVVILLVALITVIVIMVTRWWWLKKKVVLQKKSSNY